MEQIMIDEPSEDAGGPPQIAKPIKPTDFWGGISTQSSDFWGEMEEGERFKWKAM